MSDNQAALLALADRIDEANERPIVIHKGAATELRRLHAENEALKADTKSLATMSNLWAKEKALNAELVEALQRYHRIVSANAIDLDCDAAIDKAHAALAKVEASNGS